MKEISTEKKLIGRLKPYPGQKIYELDLSTLKVVEASFESVEIVHTKLGDGVKKKLVVKDNCLYEVAINYENAKKKFIKKVIKLKIAGKLQVSYPTKTK